MADALAIKQAIRQQALTLGFDAVGFASPALPPEASAHLTAFLAEGRHGEMEWMQTHADRRASPLALWPGARTILSLGHNYGPTKDPLALLGEKDKGAISCYAQNLDYHDVLKKKLRVLARSIAETHGCEVKLFVDTAPVMEKPIAVQAGLGWQGKHTCVVSRQFGSWLFLSEIFLGIALPTDVPEADHCGSCQSCLDICPTQAFTGARQIDARRCISYLTIEHKGHIPREFRRAIGNRIYGCDDCLAVCPWNKFAHVASESAYHARESLAAPALSFLLSLDDAAFRVLFRQSPVKRIGRNRFLRNVVIAAGNSGNRDYVLQLERLLGDPSPLVRLICIWALGLLATNAEYSRMQTTHQPKEPDAEVHAEWLNAAPPLQLRTFS